jgi:PmbA protein
VILERLEAALRAARAAGARAAEASHEGRELETVRFANSTVTGATLVREHQTRIRVLVGDRLGAATTSSLEPAALADAAAQAVAAARLMPPTPELPDFAVGGEVTSLPDEPPTPPGSWPTIIETIFGIAARHGLTGAGSLTNGPRELAVATTGGVRRRVRLPEAKLSVIALDGRASGYAAFTGKRLEDVDAAALAETAAETGAAARDPIDLPIGEIDVLFSPHAIAEMLEWMSNTSFSTRAVEEGTSLLSGRRGQLVCDPRITIADDWADAASVWRTPFDSEGVDKQRVVVVDHGRAGAGVVDLATGHRLGKPSTGHAAPVGAEYVESPAASHVVMAAGTESHAALLGKLERGLVVTRLHYVNGFLDTRRAAMTGMTRDGTFLVENGRRGRPVGNLRFTDSFLDMLSPDRLAGVGDTLKAVATTWSPLGAVLAPALLVRRFKFTGKSR